MEVLHLILKPFQDDYLELRIFWDNPNEYVPPHTFSKSKIDELIQYFEDYYYTTGTQESLDNLGQKLYKWLDTDDSLLAQKIDGQREILLAIAVTEKLAHLPWELLHDGKEFLVDRNIIPVRWVVRAARKISIENNPENRDLNLLFMATYPEEPNLQPLHYEDEEARILKATERQPLFLQVEESGCLEELRYLVDDYGEGYFDAFHLTGHAGIRNGQPYFITETETGDRHNASAEEIVEVFDMRFPKLIFLSGCKTGQAGRYGAVPSMAETLIETGATTVLAWGQPVNPEEATQAASCFYRELAIGQPLTKALTRTYKALRKWEEEKKEDKPNDWHMLRLYIGDTLPEALVTAPRNRPSTPKDRPISYSSRFLDKEGKIKVADRMNFVGRRRQIQTCIKALTLPSEKVGVIIHGMGGYGKSTLAARLCDRLTQFEPLVVVGYLDKEKLVGELSKEIAIDSSELEQILIIQEVTLRVRLQRVFKRLYKNFLLILDDFEQNLEPGEQEYIIKTDAKEVLKDLIEAIRSSNAGHRIVITSRYDFTCSGRQYLQKVPLNEFGKADLQKKLNRLAAFKGDSQVDTTLQQKAIELADGNSRILEWLDKILTEGTLNYSVIIQRLEGLKQHNEEWREQLEKVLARELVDQIDSSMQEILSRGLIFEIPVPREALSEICQGISNLEQKVDRAILEQKVDRAIKLGLLSVSPDKSLRVPRILPLSLPKELEALSNKGVKVLYRIWQQPTEEQQLEIHRLALQGKVKEIAVEVVVNLTRSWYRLRASRHREAKKICEETLTLIQDYRVFHILARAEQDLTQTAIAKEHYDTALKYCPPEDKQEKADILYHFAILISDQGNWDRAINLWKKSLEINKELNNLEGQANNLYQWARREGFKKKYCQANALYHKALHFYEELNDATGKGYVFHGLGLLETNQENICEAINWFQQALELNDQINYLRGKSNNLHQLGRLYLRKNELDKAQECLEEAQRIREQFLFPKTIAETLHALGQLEEKKYEENRNGIHILNGIDLTRQALEINEPANIENKKPNKNQLRRLFRKWDRLESSIFDRVTLSEATKVFKQLLELSKNIKYIDGLLFARKNLDKLDTYTHKD
jgi:CHAT domain-containing protein